MKLIKSKAVRHTLAIVMLSALSCFVGLVISAVTKLGFQPNWAGRLILTGSILIIVGAFIVIAIHIIEWTK